jgi:protease-4
MKSIQALKLILCILSLIIPATAQEAFPHYYSRNPFLMAPSGVYQEGLVGFTNPANLHFINTLETRFYWNTDGQDASSFNDWGFYSGVPVLGFGVQRQHFGKYHETDYRISTGLGSDAFALGMGYGWSNSDLNTLSRENLITSGAIIRPFPQLSINFVGNFSVESNAREGVAEIGIRPFGTPAITLFADGVLRKEMQLSDANWSTGAAIRLFPGVNLLGRYFDSEEFTVGLTINLGRSGAASQVYFDNNQNRTSNSYMVRAGERKPSIFPTIFAHNRAYLSKNLKGTIDYQNYILFDNDTHRLMDVLRDIRAAANDPRVKAITINLASVNVMPEHAWEIRNELQTAREKGKTVIAFLTNAGMTIYHLASAADIVVMDPEGSIMLPGYVMGRTYFKGTLEKLGIGFDEWRYFKYKSAAEALSRKGMSEADSMQRQAYVNDWYEVVRADISQSRNFTSDEFDRLIDDEVFFMPQRALELNLVDTLGRWSEKDKILREFTGGKLVKIDKEDLFDYSIAYQKWGVKPKIAVVYGLGICAMDEGIRARWLEKVFSKLKDDHSTKAVVFRVDSPGGDGMASDVVAEALLKCSKKKPVIVSQGQVAGSGGYWISMYGNRIIAGPTTITGSIGVIGGWLYDKGFSDKLGMTSDYVKRGAHAELGFGVGIPFSGIRLPARNLTPEEQAKVETIIKKFYDSFVEKVAKGRGMTVEKVREIAQGHFYSGLEGQQVGLVDELGGMLTALAVAKQQARIDPDTPIKIVEIPEHKGLFKPPFSGPDLELRIKNDQVFRYLKMATEQPGKPLPMLLPGTYPTKE